MLKVETYQSRIYLNEPLELDDRFQHFCFNGNTIFYWKYGSYLLKWNWDMLVDTNAIQQNLLRLNAPTSAF